MLVWQEQDGPLQPKEATYRTLVTYKAAIVTARDPIKPNNAAYFGQYAPWLTDAPPRYKVILTKTLEQDKRKLDFETAKDPVSYLRMFA